MPGITGSSEWQALENNQHMCHSIQTDNLAESAGKTDRSAGKTDRVPSSAPGETRIPGGVHSTPKLVPGMFWSHPGHPGMFWSRPCPVQSRPDRCTYQVCTQKRPSSAFQLYIPPPKPCLNRCTYQVCTRPHATCNAENAQKCVTGCTPVRRVTRKTPKSALQVAPPCDV